MASSHQDERTGQIRDEIMREHRELMALILSLGKRASQGSDSGEHWSADLLEILTRLRTSLHHHFAEEEEGPFAKEFPLQFPDLADKLEDILGEHRGLMERVDQLLREVEEASEQATDDEVRTIRKDVRAFIEAIRAHESAENSLLQHAYLDDIGGLG